jgi:hypothetical protein
MIQAMTAAKNEIDRRQQREATMHGNGDAQ